MNNAVFKIILELSVIAIVAECRKVDNHNVGCIKCHPLDKNKINVHLIPHSHDDVGWLKTLDEYYYGVNTGQISVRLIISSVVEALKRNPDRRYIQVETAYFHKWWKDNEDMRTEFKQLVDRGQIEMVNGAWSMNDEACVNYQSIIDQFTFGLRKIEESVGKCGRPRVGWQIDPFGHSREHASILSQMGFDGVLFARMDHDDKSARQAKGQLNFLWHGSANLEDSTIFAGCFPTSSYSEPDSFCWDINCGDDQIVDNPNSTIYNIKKKVDQFTKILKNFTNYYPPGTKNIIVPMGGDFHFQAAGYNFLNMDKLIKGFSEYNSEFNVIYSTPSCYIKAINEAAPALKLKTDDFFPYSDQNYAFWAGYFTSRPTVKRSERVGHNILQAAKRIHALSPQHFNDGELEELKMSMGALQHHDAITGTQQQHVADDYIRMLSAGIRKAEAPLGNIISDILNSNLTLELSSCQLANMSICNVSQNSDNFVIAVYNPLGWAVTHHVRLPVKEGIYEINGPDGAEIYDLTETLFSFDYVRIKGEKPSTYELLFAAKDVPAMGLKVYHVARKSTGTATSEQLLRSSNVFEMDKESGLLKSVTVNDVALNVTQKFHFYQSHDGFSEVSDVASGAYIFRPFKNTPTVFENATILRKFSGNLVEEVHQKWENTYANIYQSIRWYKNENYVEFDWIVGNIDLDHMTFGKEIISRFSIKDFDNQGVFYTDSNGREMLRRVKNKRPTYKYNITQEPVASNYYPVTSRIVIKDERRGLRAAILTDRSQGGTSLNKGEIELMVHRRLIFDDERGVGESLDEFEFETPLYARGTHYLVFGPAKKPNKDGRTTAAHERILAQKKLLQPWVGLSRTDLSFEELKDQMQLSYEPLENNLPPSINILSLEPWTSGSLLLRLEHIMEKDDDAVLSLPMKIENIQELFKDIEITGVTETTLSAHLTLEELEERGVYTWKSEDGTSHAKQINILDSEREIVLCPMEIRTFILKTNRSETSGSSMNYIWSPSILISVIVLICCY
ncbi:unnamed protein product [Phyllotreta striolata]|uniref:Alpha-mannosidase n=1 Tax=Phyllotreta striolata TaxID=444603 RepID=A0A9N9TJL9_PHYSR|nr:unnamed protein product [Phyllotreta striolata]